MCFDPPTFANFLGKDTLENMILSGYDSHRIHRSVPGLVIMSRASKEPELDDKIGDGGGLRGRRAGSTGFLPHHD
jgi:hypothetical protein